MSSVGMAVAMPLATREHAAPERIKPVFNEVVGHVWHRIRRSLGSPFIGSPNKGGTKPRLVRRVEVKVVAGHHQYLRRLQCQPARCGGISLRMRLIDADHFAGNKRVPHDAIAA